MAAVVMCGRNKHAFEIERVPADRVHEFPIAQIQSQSPRGCSVSFGRARRLRLSELFAASYGDRRS